MVSIFLPLAQSAMSELSTKAFNQLKVVAKKFQKVNPKLVYNQAVEKAVEGFRGIHSSRVLHKTSTEQEFEKVYTGFLKEHNLPLEDEVVTMARYTP